jgi:hypothetical protein
MPPRLVPEGNVPSLKVSRERQKKRARIRFLALPNAAITPEEVSPKPRSFRVEKV